MRTDHGALILLMVFLMCSAIWIGEGIRWHQDKGGHEGYTHGK